MFMSIGTQVTFAASHYLPDHQGKCRQNHGHTWKVEIDYQNIDVDGPADLPSDGILVDFGLIKQLIRDQFDHVQLNSFMDTPTAEKIAWYILRLMPEIWEHCYWLEITVWESAFSYAQASMHFHFRRED